MRIRPIIAIIFLWSNFGLLTLSAQVDTFKIVYYNLLRFPGSTSNRVDSIKAIIDYLKPDIFAVEELEDITGANLIRDNALNQNGRSGYQYGTYYDGYDSDNLIYYKSDLLGLIKEDTISTNGSTSFGQSRYIRHTRLFYRDSNLAIHQDTVFLDLFAMHLSASMGGTDSIERQLQCRALKNWMNTKTGLKYIIAGGDLNVYTSDEISYQILLDSGNYKIKDPINRPGNWHNTFSFTDIHTQSTRRRAFNGGATGGLDDRFDFILVSDSLMNTTSRVVALPNTYKAVGNNGQLFNDSLTHPPISTAVPWSVLSALYNNSDHLPVYMEFIIKQKVITLTDPEANEGWRINIFPNPSDGEFRFKDLRTGSEDILLEIWNQQGKKIESFNFPAGNSEHYLNLQHLPAGMYILRAISGQEIHQSRWIKN